MANSKAEWTFESAMDELRRLFPDQPRRVQVTETALGRTVVVVVGGQSTAYSSLSDCMAMAHRWHKALNPKHPQAKIESTNDPLTYS